MKKEGNGHGIFDRFLINILIIIGSFIKMISELTIPKFWKDDEENVVKIKGIKDIPGPLSLPYFGTLLTSSSLKNKDYIQANEDQHQKYGSLVKEEFYGNFPMIKVLDPDHIQIMLKHWSTIRPPMEIIKYYRNSRPDRYDCVGIVSSNGDEYSFLHHKFSNVMSPTYIRSLTTSLDQIAMDFIQLLQNHTPQVIPDFPTVLNLYIAESSFYNGFGKRMGLLEGRPGSEKLERFVQVHEDYWLMFHNSWNDNWKYYSTPLWKHFVAAEDELLDCVEDLIQSAIKTEQVSGLLELILKDPETSYKTKRLMLTEIILGATEPVLDSILLCMWCFTKYENVSEKIYCELKEALPTKDSPIDNSVFDQLPYLRACILEATRICPTAGNSQRILQEPVTLGEYELPKNTFVEIELWHACLQEGSFYKAKEFLPERWIYNENNTPPFKPHRRILSSGFGVGSRSCIGKRFALESMRIVLARIFRNFEVKFEKGMETECNWLNAPVRPVEVTLTQRPD